MRTHSSMKWQRMDVIIEDEDEDAAAAAAAADDDKDTTRIEIVEVDVDLGVDMDKDTEGHRHRHRHRWSNRTHVSLLVSLGSILFAVALLIALGRMLQQQE